ncbi:hypothetical protein [Francisella frigiditurris]|uniref:Uncharacterized protein n=1 Tax=Francisella frigiditurris TaxID=1542390 RepID=A0A1J0KVT3_9GAMM|nr:hypothetical protein [Francisella frigiditurris]APC97928.1 hypothetical protein KX01_1464 [Francisella frigiditurris]
MTYHDLANSIIAGKYICDISDKTWNSAFKYIISNLQLFKFDRDAIHLMWTENGGHIRKKVADDNLVLEFLKRTLPKYNGGNMTLYRGECEFLYKDNKIGFSWTPKIEVAKMFARGLNAIESRGVLLKANVSKNAILCEPNNHSSKWLREFEYICNPKLIKNIEVLKYFEKYK